MELLAPVNADTLQAALDAGADAVYFGLTRLNARRGAKNFAPDELAAVVQRIHAANAKAHLTLNIDLATRELGLAARTLQLASEAGVDAVIVRDPAILALIPQFPQLQFHLSTQSGISSSAGVRAAKELGCHRVVLAREMTREEIRAAAGIPGIETEVFVQGAMCFCCSGRCLLSSWVGGRSGNRGTCASPCRVAWKTADTIAHPMSMHDLCLLERLGELREMGVASLKIEGRLKSASWVHRAVSLYRKALDGTENLDDLREEATDLGNYTGRTLTTAYYDCHFDHLTDEDAGRIATPKPLDACASTSPTETPRVIIAIRSDAQRGTCFDFAYGAPRETFRLPWQRVANPRRAIALADLITEVETDVLTQLEHEISCPPDLAGLLLPRRCTTTVQEALQEFLRHATKEDDGQVRIALPDALATQLQPSNRPASENCHALNELPDRIRLQESQLNYIQQFNNKEFILIINKLPGKTPLAHLAQQLPDAVSQRLIIALPQVIYEEDIVRLKEDILFAKARNWLLEVNSWDTLQLAREAEAPFETGAGLAVLNPQSARFLHHLGAQVCMVSPEIDEEKFAELCASCEVPLTATVFARLALMTTRAELPPEFAPSSDGQPGPAFEDARGTRLHAHREGCLTVLRPDTPYDWRRLNSPKIHVAHLVVDLCGSPEPARDLAPAKGTPFLFNFDRTLR